jgi:hypothetical protein
MLFGEPLGGGGEMVKADAPIVLFLKTEDYDPD